MFDALCQQEGQHIVYIGQKMISVPAYRDLVAVQEEGVELVSLNMTLAEVGERLIQFELEAHNKVFRRVVGKIDEYAGRLLVGRRREFVVVHGDRPFRLKIQVK